jgi:hypothetical protein
MKNERTKQNVKIAVTVTVATVAVIVLDYFRIMYFGSGCISKAVFGVSCPACGMTRAFLSLFCLKFEQAFYYNPAWWTVPVAALCCLLTFIDKKRTKLWIIIFAAAILILIGVWIFRLATGTTV